MFWLNFFVFKIYARHFFLVADLGATGAALLAHFWQGGAGLLTTKIRAKPLLLKTLGNWFKFGLQTFLPHLFPRWRWRCLFLILWAKDWLAELESLAPPLDDDWLFDADWLALSDPPPFEDDEDWLPDEPKNFKIKLSILQSL
jgi:hypothetical protein